MSSTVPLPLRCLKVGLSKKTSLSLRWLPCEGGKAQSPERRSGERGERERERAKGTIERVFGSDSERKAESSTTRLGNARSVKQKAQHRALPTHATADLVVPRSAMPFCLGHAERAASVIRGRCRLAFKHKTDIEIALDRARESGPIGIGAVQTRILFGDALINSHEVILVTGFPTRPS